ncbi:unnamed protein product [Euphydryas editha]|uniref:Endonuclease/exonuclease/phosphatase domain-containing protein n=1 Tax=Euphydryas editha TaxID=104508 RepID=A0AAU9U0H3_EUPED|nr:unnamed protein product [Euphydryas editha]
MQKQNEIDIVHLNIRSLRKQFNELLVLLNNCEGKIDIIILSEINIKKDEVAHYSITGYTMYANTREEQRGGGVIIYIKENINFTADTLEISASETLHGKLKLEKSILHILATYRPPKTNKSRFVEEINTFLKDIPAKEDVVFIGDMNLDLLGDKFNKTTNRYKNMLCGHGLQCAIPVTAITREAVVDGQLTVSCIDHVWVRAHSAQRADAHILASNLSDHHMIGLRLAVRAEQNESYDNGVKRYVINNKLVREKLDSVDWSELLSIECPLLIYDKIGSIFSGIYEKSKIELKISNKRNSQPWVNAQLSRMMDRRDELFRAWKENVGKNKYMAGA